MYLCTDCIDKAVAHSVLGLKFPVQW